MADYYVATSKIYAKIQVFILFYLFQLIKEILLKKPFSECELFFILNTYRFFALFVSLISKCLQGRRFSPKAIFLTYGIIEELVFRICAERLTVLFE